MVLLQYLSVGADELYC